MQTVPQALVYLRDGACHQLLLRNFFYGRLKVFTRKTAICARVTGESGQ